MTSEDQPSEGFSARMAFAVRKDPAAAARRTRVRLQLLLITLAWASAVPLLVLYALFASPRHGDLLTAAATVTVLGPFVAAVVATRNQRFGAGGVYIVLTFLMIVPALALAHFA